MTADLQRLGSRLVGRWITEATHPALPGAVIRGSSEIEWLEGQRFLIYRSSYDHSDIPDSISIVGETDGLQTHYFDSRGVHRTLALTVAETGWEMFMDRNAPAGSFASPDGPFSQHMTFTFDDEDRVISGHGELSYDNVTWQDDMQITYRRAG